jgi:hypothetical protein
MLLKSWFLVSLLGFAVGCSPPEDGHVFTLYSNHSKETTFRFHVATFDATPKGGARADGPATKYFADDNQLNCDKVAKLLKEEWDLSTKGMGHEQKKFWCEKGRYRK